MSLCPGGLGYKHGGFGSASGVDTRFAHTLGLCSLIALKHHCFLLIDMCLFLRIFCSDGLNLVRWLAWVLCNGGDPHDAAGAEGGPSRMIPHLSMQSEWWFNHVGVVVYAARDVGAGRVGFEGITVSALSCLFCKANNVVLTRTAPSRHSTMYTHCRKNLNAMFSPLLSMALYR